jgi:hypothetical protein
MMKRVAGLVIGAISLGAFAQSASRVLRLELNVKSVRTATTTASELIEGAQVTEWTVVETEPNSRLPFLPTSATQSVLFLGDVGCMKAWRATTLWCVVPRVATSEGALWGPVSVPLTPSPATREAAKQAVQGRQLVAAAEAATLTPEKIGKLRASAQTWKLNGVEVKAPLAAESLRDLLRRLEAGSER